MINEMRGAGDDPLLEFVDQILPQIKRIGREFPNSLEKAAIESMGGIIAELGDNMKDKPPQLTNVPMAAQQAIQGDADSTYALAVLSHNFVGGMLVFNAIANLAVIVGGDIAKGYEELSNVLSSPEYKRLRWYILLYNSMTNSLEFTLWPITYGYFKQLASDPAHFHRSILRHLILDSSVVRATRSVPFDLESPYEFCIKKSPYLFREVDEVISVMKEYNLPFYFRVTRVEPRVLLLSLLLYYCHLNNKFELIVPPADVAEVIGRCPVRVRIDVADAFRAWENYKPVLADPVMKFVRENREDIPRRPTHSGYPLFLCLEPYANFFEDIEGAMRGSAGNEKLVAYGLTKIAVPFLAHFYPFITTTDEGAVIVEGTTGREALNLMEALALGSHFSATYAIQLLSGIHAWRRIRHGRSRSASVLIEPFGRARSASYDPFLPPEVMIRRPLLVIMSVLFKVTNIFFKMAGRPDLAFEPTGNVQEDLTRVWEMIPESKQFGAEGLDAFLKSVERDSYDLFLRVLEATELEWGSVFVTKQFREVAGGAGR